MKRIIPILIACHCAFAIQAPTITGIVALNDTTVRLTWHSNDDATQGFYILRVDPYMSFSRRIDTLSAAGTEYVDTVLPGESYGYGVAAFSADDVSDETPYSFIEMPGIKRIFLAPDLYGLWDTVTASIELGIIDRSTTETGFRVLRAEDFGAFSERTVLLSDNPSLNDTLCFTDNTAKIGAWYTYRVIVYDNKGEGSSEINVFAYPKTSTRPTKKIVPGSKVSDFPIRYGNWALKQGDTICVQQDSIPFDSCTLIDVGDREKPVFAGRIENSVPLRLQEPQSYAALGNILLYRSRGSMVQYRFNNGIVDSVCSVLLYDVNFNPRGMSIGEVVGILNNNVAVTRYIDDKHFYYDTYFFSQEKLVPLGTFWRGEFVPCNEVTFLFFSAGKAYDYLVDGFKNGTACDMSHPVQQVYLSFDFSFDPRTPVEGFSENVPDTVFREYNGYLTSDTMIKKSKAIFVDSLKSLMYLFSETKLSVYSFSLETGFLKQPHTPSLLNNRLILRYISAGRRLYIGYDGIFNDAAIRIKLFSLKGTLLFDREIVPGTNVNVPHGISGMVLVKVGAANKRSEGKIIIAQ